MKTKARKTVERLIVKRISAPQYKKTPDGQLELLISFVDKSGYLRHLPTTKDIFLRAAGRNEEGEAPDGLDFLVHRDFTLHLDKRNKFDDADKPTVIGLDIIQSRVYRSGVVPTHQVGQETLRIIVELDGAVMVVDKRPPNFRPDAQRAIIAALDNMLVEKKGNITAGTPLKSKAGQSLGRVVTAMDGVIEVRPNAAAGRNSSRPKGADSALEEVIAETEDS